MDQKSGIMISIRPEWTERIKDGSKTLDLRKSKPKQDTPFTCYIYESGEYEPAYNISKYAGMYRPGSVIGEFTCDCILEHCEMANIDLAEQMSLVKRENIRKYAKRGVVYGFHIQNLVIYPVPKPLREFGLRRAPQSWCYVQVKRADDA